MSQDPARPWELPAEEDESLSLPAFLSDPVGVLKRRWRWAALALVVGLVATTAATLMWRPSYVAEATVLITSQQIPEDFVRSTVRDSSGMRIATCSCACGRSARGVAT